LQCRGRMIAVKTWVLDKLFFLLYEKNLIFTVVFLWLNKYRILTANHLREIESSLESFERETRKRREILLRLSVET